LNIKPVDFPVDGAVKVIRFVQRARRETVAQAQKRLQKWFGV